MSGIHRGFFQQRLYQFYPYVALLSISILPINNLKELIRVNSRSISEPEELLWTHSSICPSSPQYLSKPRVFGTMGSNRRTFGYQVFLAHTWLSSHWVHVQSPNIKKLRVFRGIQISNIIEISCLSPSSPTTRSTAAVIATQQVTSNETERVQGPPPSSKTPANMTLDPHPVLSKIVSSTSDAVNQHFRAPHLSVHSTAWLSNEDCQTILQFHRFHWLPKQRDLMDLFPLLHHLSIRSNSTSIARLVASPRNIPYPSANSGQLLR
ncbi:hypothetical protein BD769DRAFT_375667 [Suillus cothurnatus]|nr:hypothetical protein BD769DRAFT_375667 [Suillus cothurnatus]